MDAKNYYKIPVELWTRDQLVIELGEALTVLAGVSLYAGAVTAILGSIVSPHIKRWIRKKKSGRVEP